jgi:hypothetical protein
MGKKKKKKKKGIDLYHNMDKSQNIYAECMP